MDVIYQLFTAALVLMRRCSGAFWTRWHLCEWSVPKWRCSWCWWGGLPWVEWCTGDWSLTSWNAGCSLWLGKLRSGCCLIGWTRSGVVWISQWAEERWRERSGWWVTKGLRGRWKGEIDGFVLRRVCRGVGLWRGFEVSSVREHDDVVNEASF
jgi:hypothetical protein